MKPTAEEPSLRKRSSAVKPAQTQTVNPKPSELHHKLPETYTTNLTLDPAIVKT